MNKITIIGSGSVGSTIAYTLTVQGIAVGGVIVAYATILVLGASFSLVPASLWPSVPKLVDAKIIGSGEFSTASWVSTSLRYSGGKSRTSCRPEGYSLSPSGFSSTERGRSSPSTQSQASPSQPSSDSQRPTVKNILSKPTSTRGLTTSTRHNVSSNSAPRRALTSRPWRAKT